jgi:hypothetical protein
MNAPAGSQVRLVIVGATGMVGGYALRYALDHPSVGVVTVIGRKKLDISHPKLRQVLHRDFADCSGLAQSLSGQDAALFCLGVYTGAVPDAEFRKITVDYTIEFARVLRASSPGAAFSFLSGSGADQTEQSRVAFARYKGRPKKSCLRQAFLVFTSYGPPTSILSNPGRNRTSATVCCARFIRRFGCSSRTRPFAPTTRRAREPRHQSQGQVRIRFSKSMPTLS